MSILATEARGRRLLLGALWLLPLAVILLAGLALRTVGLEYDRPYDYHPDEWLIVRPAVGILLTGDVNPHQFLYPSFLVEAETLIVAFVHKFGGVWLVTPAYSGVPGLNIGSISEIDPSQYGFVAWGRHFVSLLGVLIALVAALAAVQFARSPARPVASAQPRLPEADGNGDSRRLAGLAAAAFAAFAVLPLDHSRFLTTDIPAAFFAALVMLAAIRALSVEPTAGRRWIVAGAFFVGLATSTKYNAVVLAIVPAMAFIAICGGPGGFIRNVRGVLLSWTPWLSILAAILGFAVGTPSIVFDGASVIAGMQQQVLIYNVEGHLGAQGNSAEFYLRYLWQTGLGPVLSLLSLGGIVYGLIRHRAADLALVSFTILYFILVSIPQVRFERNLMPLVPFAAVLAGNFFADSACFITGRLVQLVKARKATGGGGERRGETAASGAIARTASLAVVFGLVFAQPVSAAIGDAQAHNLPDTRSIAAAWIETNLPAGAQIARENYTPQPDLARYRVAFLSPLASHDAKWYRAKGFRYLIISNYLYDRFNASGYEPERAFYRQLLQGKIVYAVGPSEAASGPRISIADLAP